MKNYEYTQIDQNTGLLTLLNSLIPQSIAIKDFNCPDGINYLIIDTAVRNKLTHRRFEAYPVKNNHVYRDKAHYVEPTQDVIKFADKIMKKNQDLLKTSFLTEREIEEIIQGA